MAVLLFASPADRRRTPLTEPTKHSMNLLLNDLQILALERPKMLAWIAEFAHRMARRVVEAQRHRQRN